MGAEPEEMGPLPAGFVGSNLSLLQVWHLAMRSLTIPAEAARVRWLEGSYPYGFFKSLQS